MGLLISGCEASGPPLRTDVTFNQRLLIPPLADGTVTDEGTRVFTLRAQEGTRRWVPSSPTETWGFNGDYFGPTLRAEVGERVRVDFTNDLPEGTSLHWHGMHLPAEMDGGPHQMVEPGDTWQPSWLVKQEPATLWYHPHPHGVTQEHVHRGLAGFFLLDPPGGPDQRLPHEYGVDDVPVAVQDKKLAEDGELVHDAGGNEIGLIGNLVMANGVVGAYHDVSTELIRLRLLNGSTARTYSLGFDDNRIFDQIASDGGLLEEPYQTTRTQLSPGERAEIVVRMVPGERLRLRSFGADLGSVVAGFAFGAADEVDVLELRAAAKLRSSPSLPAQLADLDAITDDEIVGERSFVLEGREINGRRMAMGRIDAVPEVGTAEVWEVTNRNPFPHNFHVHDVQFQVESVNGKQPPPELRGWKDTVYLLPQTPYRLRLRFADYTDVDTPYMFHCHLLLHEDEGMMGQFVIVEPGQSARSPIGHEH
jgi:FtsP/CotA-like multicopper oxidase with cupredoxin domain